VDYNWIVDGILKNSMPYETHKDSSFSTGAKRGRKAGVDYLNKSDKRKNAFKLGKRVIRPK
jgi:hypothetical protein